MAAARCSRVMKIDFVWIPVSFMCAQLLLIFMGFTAIWIQNYDHKSIWRSDKLNAPTKYEAVLNGGKRLKKYIRDEKRRKNDKKDKKIKIKKKMAKKAKKTRKTTALLLFLHNLG